VIGTAESHKSSRDNRGARHSNGMAHPPTYLQLNAAAAWRRSKSVQQELLMQADVRTTMNVYTQAVGEQKRAAHSSVVRMVLA